MNRRISWYRTKIDKEELRRLTQRSDAKAFVQTGGYLLVIALTGFLAFWVQRNLSWPWWIAALFVHGTVYAFLVNAMHELSHDTVFKTRALNRFFLRLVAFLGSNSHVFFKASHSRHHQNTLHPPDDEEVVLPMKFTLKGFFQTAFVNFPRFRAAWGQHLRVACGRFNPGWEAKVLEPVRKEAVRWSRFMIAGHVLIAAVSFYFGLWIIPVLVTLAPFYGEWLFYLLNNTQHVGLQDNVGDFRLCCRTIEVNPLLRFLYWHMNWHIEHHMFAAVPCYNLKKLHRAIEHELPPSPKGLAETWYQISSILFMQKQDPSYQYVQPLPAAQPDNS